MGTVNKISMTGNFFKALICNGVSEFYLELTEKKVILIGLDLSHVVGIVVIIDQLDCNHFEVKKPMKLTFQISDLEPKFKDFNWNISTDLVLYNTDFDEVGTPKRFWIERHHIHGVGHDKIEVQTRQDEMSDINLNAILEIELKEYCVNPHVLHWVIEWAEKFDDLGVFESNTALSYIKLKNCNYEGTIPISHKTVEDIDFKVSLHMLKTYGIWAWGLLMIKNCTISFGKEKPIRITHYFGEASKRHCYIAPRVDG